MVSFCLIFLLATKQILRFSIIWRQGRACLLCTKKFDREENNNFEVDDRHLRNRQSHDNHAQRAETSNNHVYGVSGVCALVDANCPALEFFHPAENRVFDFMHVWDEGALQYEMACVLYHMIKVRGYFSLKVNYS